MSSSSDMPFSLLKVHICPNAVSSVSIKPSRSLSAYSARCTADLAAASALRARRCAASNCFRRVSTSLPGAGMGMEAAGAAGGLAGDIEEEEEEDDDEDEEEEEFAGYAADIGAAVAEKEGGLGNMP